MNHYLTRSFLQAIEGYAKSLNGKIVFQLLPHDGLWRGSIETSDHQAPVHSVEGAVELLEAIYQLYKCLPDHEKYKRR